MTEDFLSRFNFESSGTLRIPDTILVREKMLIKEDLNKEDLSRVEPEYLQKMLDNVESEINFSRVNRWIDYHKDDLVSEEMFLQEILPILDVEKIDEDKVLLYHSTPYRALLEILESSTLDPVNKHGNITWGHPGINPGDKLEVEKFSKVYLAKSSHALWAARAIQSAAFGQSTYILEVQANIANLKVDEDSHSPYDRRQFVWALSLANGTCSHLGSIDNYRVIGRLINNGSRDYNLSSEDISYIAKLWGEKIPGVEKQVEMKFGGTITTIEEEAQNLLKKGLDIEKIKIYTENEKKL